MTLSSKKILVIEPDHKTRLEMGRSLQNLGAEICLCGSGLSAMKALSEATYDVAIVCLDMKGLSGAEFVPLLKDKHSHTRVIGVSEYGRHKKDELIKIGVNRFFAREESIIDLPELALEVVSQSVA